MTNRDQNKNSAVLALDALKRLLYTALVENDSEKVISMLSRDIRWLGRANRAGNYESTVVFFRTGEGSRYARQDYVIESESVQQISGDIYTASVIMTFTATGMQHRATATLRPENGEYKVLSFFTDVPTELLERSEIDKVVENAENKLRNVVANIPAGIFVIKRTSDGVCLPVYMSDMLCDMLGFEREAYRRRIAKKIPIVNSELVERLFKNNNTNVDGIRFNKTLRMTRTDKSSFWASINTNVRRLENGEYAVYGLIYDVSEHMEVAGKAQLADERFSAIMNNINVGIFTEILQDNEYKLLFANDSFYSMLGFTEKQFSEELVNVEKTVYPPDREMLTSITQRALDNGEVASCDFRAVKRNGELVWLHGRFTQAPISETGETAFLGTLEDIDSRMAASEQLDFLNTIAGKLLGEQDANAAIQSVLAEIANYFDSERSYIFELNATKDKVSNSYEYCAGGVKPKKEQLQSLPVDTIAFWAERFMEGGYIEIDNVARLDKNRSAERKLLINFGISSVLAVRLVQDNQVIGFIGVDNPKRRIVHVDNLSAIGDYISVMIARRNYDARLRNEGEELVSLMRDAPGGFARFKVLANGGLEAVYINENYAKLVDMTVAEVFEVMKEDTMSIMHPSDVQSVVDAITACVRGEGPAEACFGLLKKGGGSVPVRAKGSLVRDSRGEPYLNLYYTDISEELMLKERYRRAASYRELLKKNSLGSYRFNVTRNLVLECASDYRTIVELGKDGTMDSFLKQAVAYLPNDDVRREYCSLFSREALKRAFNNDEFSLEYEHLFLLDDYLWVKTSADITKNPATGDIEAFIYAQNINNERVMRTLVDTTVNNDYDFIIAVNVSNGRYRTYMRKGGANCCFKEEGFYGEVTNESYDKVFYVEDKERVIREISMLNIISRLESSNRMETAYRIYKKNGDVAYKRLVCAYLDEMKQTIVLFRSDITALVEAQRKEREAVERAAKVKSDFFARMSHEMRTPLNAIIGFAKLGKDEASDIERSTENFEHIADSGKYLLGMINDILDTSSLENGKLTLNRGWHRLKEIIEPVVEMIEPGMKAKRINFVLPMDINAPTLARVECYVDKMRLQQILVNILNNACKFTPEGGTVSWQAKHLSHNERETSELIIVKDNGCGMSKEFVEHLGEPFSQERNIYSDVNSGTGLGLNIVKRICEVAGFDLEVDSELGKGTEFRIKIRYQYRLSEPNADNGAKKPPLKLNAHILLAEDNPINRMVVTRLLEKFGATCESAENGKIAVSLFANSEPGYFDAVLMDVRMPEMDGREATREIRALARPDAQRIPIIALSANAFAVDIEQSLAAGMDEHLSKPVEPEVLIETLTSRIKKAQG